MGISRYAYRMTSMARNMRGSVYASMGLLSSVSTTSMSSIPCSVSIPMNSTVMGRRFANIAANIQSIGYRPADSPVPLFATGIGLMPNRPACPSRLACRSRVKHFAPSLLSSGGAIFLPVLTVPSRRVGRRGGERCLSCRCLPCSPFLAYLLCAAGEGEKLID